MEMPMTISKRRSTVILTIVLAAVFAFEISPFMVGSWAQIYPARPIKLTVPLTPGSAIDVLARVTEPHLSSRLGQPIVIDNRAGGGGTIATKAIKNATPDGYSLLFTGLIHTLGPATSQHADYDPVKDFAAIGTVGTGSWVLVVAATVPASSIRELIAYAKANPAELKWGYGVNTGPQLVGEAFKKAAGIDITSVSYKGGAQVMPDMLGGRIHMNIATTATLAPLVHEGKLRALAVTSRARSPLLPDVPTMAEAGFPRLTLGFWAGLLAPAATPVEIVNRLNAELNGSVKSPAMTASLGKLGFDPLIGSPQDFTTLLEHEAPIWREAAESAGMLSQ